MPALTLIVGAEPFRYGFQLVGQMLFQNDTELAVVSGQASNIWPPFSVLTRNTCETSRI